MKLLLDEQLENITEAIREIADSVEDYALAGLRQRVEDLLLPYSTIREECRFGHTERKEFCGGCKYDMKESRPVGRLDSSKEN